MLDHFTWCVESGASIDTEIRANKVQFGDGYSQFSSYGINNNADSAQYMVKGYLTTINEVKKFLIDHKGVIPFTMDIDGEIKTYISTGVFSRNHLGANVWTLSFSVEQFYIP